MNPVAMRYYKPENNIWGYDQEYKGIKLKPIRIKDVYHREMFYKLFAVPQKYIPDYQVLKMSYLKFLLYVVQGSISNGNNKEELSEKLIELLSHITGIDNISYSYTVDENAKDILEVSKIYINIGDIQINEGDFDNIREIVLAQNGLTIEYVESYNPSLEKNLEFLNRNTANITFEDQIFVMASLLSVPVTSLENYTLYQFNSHLERMTSLEKYRIINPLEISGQIKSKTGEELARHYFYHSENTNRYDRLLLDKDTFIKQSGLSDPDSGDQYIKK
jgi:hypothetical protein